MKTKKDIKPDLGSSEALRDAAMLLQLAAQGEKDVQEGRFLPQKEALARVRSHLRAQ